MRKLRIAKSRSPIKDANCYYKMHPTETSADGTLLYISNYLYIKTKIALYIEKSTELTTHGLR